MPTSPAGPAASWPIHELLGSYRRRELSPVEVVEECLARVRSNDPLLHAYLCVTEELARTDAKASASRFSGAGEPRPLEGIPVAVKDVFPLAGYPTTFGSLVHRGDPPRPDSGVVRRLREAGAIAVGKTNTAEFGQSATTDNQLSPPTVNPWDPGRTAGGSSGGSAAAVAAGTATVGLGTDGGGSVRIPAAFTGLVGFKPTPGLCPNEGGLMAMSPFSSPGSLSWRTADARVVLESLAETGFPRCDPGQAAVGYMPAWEPIDASVAELVEAAVARMSDLGHAVVETAVDVTGWRELFGVLVIAEEGRERGSLLHEHPEELTRYERRSLEEAAKLSARQIRRAEEGLGRFRQRVDAALGKFDVLVTPATAVTAFPVGQRPTRISGQSVDRLWGAFPFTAPWNVAGCPAVALPCGFVEGLPASVQLIGRAGADGALLNFAQDLEQALGVDNQAVLERWTI